MTPQVRSRTLLTERGYLVATVEGKKKFPAKDKRPCPVCHHQQLIEISVDLWNVFDLVAEHPVLRERMYVQVTSQANHASRRNKILGSFEVKLVLLAGARVLIQSWKKNTSNRFEVREEEITLKDFASAHHYPNTVAELVEIKRKEKQPDLPPGSTLPLTVIKDEEMPF